MTALRSRPARVAAIVLSLVLGLAAAVAWLNVRGEEDPSAAAAARAPTPELLARGAYLARAGNCAACHTDRGGAAYAGGKGIATPFGTVYAGNLTPDRETGIGAWSAADFWRALHHGRSRDGRLLYPAFPYPDYTLVTREDSDALYAFLRSQAPVRQATRAHDLRFPYNTQAALAVWRALFFSPATFHPEAAKSAEWNRGAYLVRGLGHCQACHAPRNAFGATQEDRELGGGLIPLQNWYAPSLAAPGEAGVQGWSGEEIVRLLKDGTSARGATVGPMAEVVFGSTQHLEDKDLWAIASFLRELPQQAPPARASEPASRDVLALGEKIYQDRCAECHGAQGEGRGSAYPALAGHRTVTMGSSANLVKVILGGGFPPTTGGNPRPYGMPPFGQSLNDDEVAAVASFVRGAWGNPASRVTALDVQRLR
ncbi:c-type cytochrome [Ramlibacter alkalitolerans]|uniref:Cytochrome c n=1 Tax=Ramlibacter alkalitolerans TaxID=2039631 RepID=A0ABS1JLV5_9BURK|nr:cytochrome c [Ramlibacter alkalitolerans]MBL0425178.1 cytochrome c [Ramlibacter alkalitolerans]